MQEKASAQAKLVSDVYMSDSSDDLDDAAAWVSPTGQDVDPVIEKRVRRKIDLFFMPTFILGYGLVYYDKVSFLFSCANYHLQDSSGNPRICVSLRHDD